MPRLVLLSGCSGGGKSTLLAALARTGYATVPEPGRRIVAEELAGDGVALPWRDLAAFARRALAMAEADLLAAQVRGGTTIFDRGLIDAAAALARAGGELPEDGIAARLRYETPVYLTPPWPDIFVADPERRHAFEAAVAEYEDLLRVFGRLGYGTVEIPRLPVDRRCAWLLDRLGA